VGREWRIEDRRWRIKGRGWKITSLRESIFSAKRLPSIFDLLSSIRSVHLPYWTINGCHRFVSAEGDTVNPLHHPLCGRDFGCLKTDYFAEVRDDK
jgi:hypothetical protein